METSKILSDVSNIGVTIRSSLRYIILVPTGGIAKYLHL